MFSRWLIVGLLGTAATLGTGLLMFGRELPSYLSSSARGVRSAVQESVPIEFELQRARDLVENMLPEIHAKIRLVAHEEVEVAALSKEVDAASEKLAAEANRLKHLRGRLDEQTVSYNVEGQRVTRTQAVRTLNRRFQQFKESENLLASKRELLDVRKQSLVAARETLEKVRHRKAMIEQKIESLAAQHRILKARSVDQPLVLDEGKIARADKLIAQLQKRIDVANRVLDHANEWLPLDTDTEAPLDESDLLAQVDRYLQLESDTVEVASRGPTVR